MKSMKSSYHEDTDQLYADLKGETSVESEEIAPGVVVDLGPDGDIVGLDIDLSLIRALLKNNSQPSLPK